LLCYSPLNSHIADSLIKDSREKAPSVSIVNHPARKRGLYFLINMVAVSPLMANRAVSFSNRFINRCGCMRFSTRVHRGDNSFITIRSSRFFSVG